MAMIQCFECEKSVSDSAVACPNCGFGIAAELEVRRQAELDKIEKQRREAQLIAKKKKDKRTGIGCFILFVFVCFISVCGSVVNSCSESKKLEAEKETKAAENVEKQKQKEAAVINGLAELKANEKLILKDVNEFDGFVASKDLNGASEVFGRLRPWFSGIYLKIPDVPAWYTSAGKKYKIGISWMNFKFGKEDYLRGEFVKAKETFQGFQELTAFYSEALEGENPKTWVHLSEMKIALKKADTLRASKKWIEVEAELVNAQNALALIEDKNHIELKGQKRKIDRLVKKNAGKAKRLRKKYLAQQKKMEKKKKEEELWAALAGGRPTPSAWDGTYREVEKHLKSVANDPGSIDVESCTKVYSTKNGWLVGCDYRGKNGFGALIRKSNWFTIVQGRVINVEKPSAYKF